MQERLIFFAQVIEESDRDLRGALVGESLRYRPQRLAETFDNFRSKYVKGTTMQNSTYMGYKGERLGYLERKKAKPTPDAYKYGKTDKQEPNEGMIAFISYGNRNGNKIGEDAWNFRGRGLLQITGRDNYKAIQDTINKLAPDSNVDVFKEVPKSGYTPHEAAVTGMAEWIHKNLYSIASQATKDNDEEIVKQIIDKLNNGTRSRAKRLINYRGKSNGTKSEYKPTKEIFKVNDCILLLIGTKKEKKKQDGKRAPWMEVAVEEIINYGGKHESIIDSRIRKYHIEGAGQKNWGSTVAWCASFVSWCLENSNPSYKSPHTAGSRFFINHSTLELCEVFYGALAVFSDCDSLGNIKPTGHLSLVYGKLLDKNNYALLGGNQGDMITLSPNYQFHGKSFPMNKKKTLFKIFRGFYKPKGYIIKEEDKLKDSDIYSSIKNANEKLKQKTQDTSKGENSR